MKVNRLAASFLLLLLVSAAGAQDLKGISLRLIEDKFNKPVYFIADPTGREFVVEQHGRVRMMVNGRKAAEPYLDVTDRVHEDGECGFLSIAFHPKFAENGRMFVNYTRRENRRIETVISEFKADPKADKIDKETEQVITTIYQPYNNHNGGLNKFGPDGMLYIGMGDGGSGGDPRNYAQNRKSLLGKMLRIDVSEEGKYTVPKDNPFVGDSSYAPEIWATGLRNPWRFSFDRETSVCYAGDVGQNKWEEVDVIVKGGNYGWRIREAAHPHNDRDPKPKEPLIDPIAEYSRDKGISITGGYVYRGKAFPEWKGVYFYGDYSSGRIWGLKYDAKTNKVLWQQEIPVSIQGGRGRPQISSFGEDKDGELYLTDYTPGRLYQLTPAK